MTFWPILTFWPTRVRNVRADRVSARACDILALFANEEMLQYNAWRCLVEILVLLQPSSAAAERVFSLLTTLFSKAQRRTLQKFIFTSIAQRMHDRWRWSLYGKSPYNISMVNLHTNFNHMGFPHIKNPSPYKTPCKPRIIDFLIVNPHVCLISHVICVIGVFLLLLSTQNPDRGPWLFCRLRLYSSYCATVL